MTNNQSTEQTTEIQACETELEGQPLAAWNERSIEGNVADGYRQAAAVKAARLQAAESQGETTGQITDETQERIASLLTIVRAMLDSLKCGETAETEADGQAAIDDVVALIADLRTEAAL